MAELSNRWAGRQAGDQVAIERAEAARLRAQAALTVGDPTPLGLVAFGTSALLLGTVLAGWWWRPAEQLAVLVPLLILLGGVAQFVAAMWSYRKGLTLGATFFGAFGAFFAALGVLAVAVLRLAGGSEVAGGASTAVMGPLAVVAGCFAFVAFFVFVGSLWTNLGLSLTALALTVALFLLSWALFAQGNVLLEVIAGWAGVVSGFLAFFTAAAMSIGGGVSRFLTMPSFRPWKPAL